ncbi:zinc finger, GRF-type domain containing protein [Pseudohyphozyma bogoriensis]|nr:zinc finger, GRF-type domain containing protein [Pseudohyphozyma bogoriensis]
MGGSLTQKGGQTLTRRLTNGSFGPQGEVLCLCGKKTQVFTVKKEGPNTGREFFKCAQPSPCKTFIWADDAQAASEVDSQSTATTMTDSFPSGAGNRLGSTSASTSTSPTKSRSSTVAQTPQPSPAKKVFRPVAILSDDDLSEDDVFGPAPVSPTKTSGKKAREPDEDEIEAFEEAREGSPSPTKKPRFGGAAGAGAGGGFVTSKAAPVTPTTGRVQQKTGFDAIKADPESPFHARHSGLFGGPAAASASPSVSAVGSPSAGAAGEAGSEALKALLEMGETFLPNLKALDKEWELLARKLKAKTKEAEFSKSRLAKMSEEREADKNRIRQLEAQVEELRSRV